MAGDTLFGTGIASREPPLARDVQAGKGTPIIGAARPPAEGSAQRNVLSGNEG
jgi:hypothetical protein